MTIAVDSLWHRLCHTRLRDAVRGRIDGRLDLRGFIARADLPAEVAQTTDQVARRTRLWREEKVDVASELVAHFQDGLERGRTADELIKSFGDPRQAARLIRRAKKRNRPLIWHLWRCVSWCLAAVIVIYTFLTFYLWMGRPSISTDYVAILNKEAVTVPEDQAAWPLYRAALLELGCRDGSFPAQIRGLPRDTRPGDPDWPKLTEYLTKHAGALAKLRQASARRNLGYAVTSTILPEDQRVLGKFVGPENEIPDAIAVPLPQVQLLSASAMLLAADARRAILTGEALVSHADVTAMLRQSRHTQHPLLLVCGLNAISIQDAAFDVIQETLTRHPGLWSDRQLADLGHQVAAVQLDSRRWLEGERVLFHDCVQRVYTGHDHGDGRITAAGLRYLESLVGLTYWQSLSSRLPPMTSTNTYDNTLVVASMPLLAARVASRREITERGNELYEIWIARMDEPLWQLDWKHLEDPLPEVTRDSLKYLPIHLSLPTGLGGSVKMLHERYHGRREGVLLGIALELCHREHGDWPKSLDTLAPQWLPAVPVDRITGRPLQYHIVRDRPVVYSVGNDGDDDGGRAPETVGGKPRHYQPKPVSPTASDGDWVLWSTVVPRSE